MRLPARVAYLNTPRLNRDRRGLHDPTVTARPTLLLGAKWSRPQRSHARRLLWTNNSRSSRDPAARCCSPEAEEQQPCCTAGVSKPELSRSRRGRRRTPIESNPRPSAACTKTSCPWREEWPANGLLLGRIGQLRAPRLSIHCQLKQTHSPTAPSKKTCKCRPFAKRLKGFEPSTFCMASRRSSQLSYSRAGAEYSRARGASRGG